MILEYKQMYYNWVSAIRIDLKGKHSKGRSVLMSKEEYFSLIDELKQANNEPAKKTGRQYYILER